MNGNLNTIWANRATNQANATTIASSLANRIGQLRVGIGGNMTSPSVLAGVAIFNSVPHFPRIVSVKRGRALQSIISDLEPVNLDRDRTLW